MEEPKPFPAKSLVFLTNRVGRLLANEIRQRSGMEEWGLHHAHMGIMVDLWTKEGIRQQDLAVSNIKDKATIARALDNMEQQNLVVRIPDHQDKRNKLIYLTHRGKELRKRLLPHAQRTVKEVTEGVPKEDLECCLRVLEHILKQY